MSTVTVDSTLIERPTGYGNTGTSYNVAEVIIPNAATPAGGGAGQAATVSFVFSESNLPADLNYTIEAMPDQACSVHYDNKATTGFDVILTPLASGTTLSAGTMDVVVTWPRG
jgi:hypothetical protein